MKNIKYLQKRVNHFVKQRSSKTVFPREDALVLFLSRPIQFSSMKVRQW